MVFPWGLLNTRRSGLGLLCWLLCILLLPVNEFLCVKTILYYVCMFNEIWLRWNSINQVFMNDQRINTKNVHRGASSPYLLIKLRSKIYKWSLFKYRGTHKFTMIITIRRTTQWWLLFSEVIQILKLWKCFVLLWAELIALCSIARMKHIHTSGKIRILVCMHCFREKKAKKS